MLEDSQVGKKFPGIFKGQVVSHLPCGRCKIYIPDVYPEEWKDSTSSELKDTYGQNLKGAKLPDAEQATPLFGGGASGNGMFSYPKLNSYVWCLFERNDINHPVYFASAIDIVDMNGSNTFALCTTNSENGNKLKHIIRCGKSSITIDETGSILLETNESSVLVRNDSVQIKANSIEITGSENVTVTGLLGVTLNGNDIKLESSGEINSNSMRYIVLSPFSCNINGHEFGLV